ncbi:MAG: acyl-CoA dehydrogenase family protein [Pararhodobacter sp.]|nr:acyl-CoA dehydrogenase family protein [Pararhodobacter sp.]
MLDQPVAAAIDDPVFREAVSRFVTREIVPHHADWETAGQVDRALWLKAGEAGLLCPTLPEEYGCPGGDFRHAAIITEEVARAGATGVLFYLHSEIVAPYVLHYGSEALKQRWLPEMAAGRAIGAIAMSEPSTGSDVRAIRSRAVREGDHYVLKGQKIFISNGQTADLFMVAAKTGGAEDGDAISLFLVEAALPGFGRGRVLDKVGMKAQDTSEIFLDDVRVPADHLLGEEGRGFQYLVEQLAQERLMVAIAAVAATEGALEHTIDYVTGRETFGQPLASHQNTRFEIGDMLSQIKVARVFIDWCVAEHMAGRLDGTTASMAKLWTTELQCALIDRCLQLHGGYGYMREYPIARAWADARVQRIYGGTSEIMKEIVARSRLGGVRGHKR